MTPTINAADGLSLQTYLQILRRRRWLVSLVALLVTVGAVLPALLADDVYATSAKVRVSALDREGVFQTEPARELASDRTIELVTEMEIVGSAPIRERVVEATGIDESDFEGPEVSLVSISEIVEITIEASDAETAATVADAFAEAYVEDRRSRSVEALSMKADELRSQAEQATVELDEIGQRLGTPGLGQAEVASLQLQQSTLTAQVLDYNRRADQLAVEASLRGRGTQVHEQATVPAEPRDTGTVRAGAIGLVIGALLGVAIAVVADILQDRVASREDLAAIRPDAPVLAAVPHTEGPSVEVEHPALKEAFRYLRTGIRVFGLNAELRSILVTSAISGEGKTTTAVNLARAMADAGDRVLLVDVDLRRPAVHEHFGLPNDPGLTSVVIGDAPLKDVVHFVRENLAVVAAGPPVQNPTELLGSAQFGQVMRSLVEQADFTILDSSPVLPVADPLIAAQHVDGAIVVSRVGLVRRRAVRELLFRLDAARVTIIGLVANDTVHDGVYEYYGADDQASTAASSGTTGSRGPVNR